MRRPSYLTRRRGRYAFRMRVPADVAALIGKQELHRSLATNNARTARRRAARAAVLAHQLIAAAREASMFSDDEIRQMAWDFYHNKLEEDRVLRIHGVEYPEIRKEVEEAYAKRAEIDAKLRRDLALGQFGEVAYYADYLFDEAGHRSVADPNDPDDPTDEIFRELCHALKRALVEANARAQERNQGRWDGTPSDPLLQQPPQVFESSCAQSRDTEPQGCGSVRAEVGAPAPQPPAESVAEAPAGTLARAEETPLVYVEHVIAEKQLGPRTAQKYRAAVRAFEQICGARPIRSYLHRDIIAFKDALLKAPRHYATALKFDDIAAAIAWNDQQPEARRKPTLHPRTINDGYLPYIKETFRHAADNGCIVQRIGAGVRVAATPAARRRDNPQNARWPFSAAKLQKIVTQPLFVGAKSPARLFEPGSYLDWSWKFWLPLVMLYMGVRPNELGQSEVTDLITRCGYPCLRVTTISDSDDLEAPAAAAHAKSVKSGAGDREVPVHLALVDLGFLERVRAMRKAGQTRIFPEWQPWGGVYSNSASKFFNLSEQDAPGLLARAGVKSKKTALYSLRHNFKNALIRCGFDQGEQDLLMGHASEGAGMIYRSNEAYERLIEKMQHLEHDGLDLTPVFQARKRTRRRSAGADPSVVALAEHRTGSS